MHPTERSHLNELGLLMLNMQELDYFVARRRRLEDDTNIPTQSSRPCDSRVNPHCVIGLLSQKVATETSDLGLI